MRKLVLIIICLSFLMAACGCSPDQYAVEREYWKVKKLAARILNNPAATPPNELERTVARLKDFIISNPKNILSVEAGFDIANLYLAKEEFEKARKQLKGLILNYAKSAIVCSEASFLIGKTYQVQGKWDSALEQYRKVVGEYPSTARGLEIPIYIANYYQAKVQPAKMLEAYSAAVAHYRDLIAKYPDSPLAFRAYSLLASCYGATKDWQKAAATLNTMIEKFQGKVKMDSILFEMIVIYKKELKDDLKANQTLEKLAKDYPNSKFLKTAKLIIKK